MDDAHGDTAYDRVAYPAAIFHQAHPDRLATMARLHGLPAPDIATARVLEIGGGDGVNAIAIAAAFPGAQVLSIDLAESAVRRGQAIVEACGLTNVRVEVGDIVDLAQHMDERFDYVIAHGVYAWVPQPVREATLALIGRVLSTDGVAYVSYNALPGGYLRQALRDMLLRVVAGIDDPKTKGDAAVAFLTEYGTARDGDTSAQKSLRSEARALARKPHSILFHDELGDFFAPQALTDVVNAAAEQGLQYLNDGNVGMMGGGFFASAEADMSTAAVIAAQQRGDDNDIRFFRWSLFVRDSATPQRILDIDAIRGLYATSYAKQTEPGTFSVRDGTFAIKDPRVLAILERLIDDMPHRVQVGELTGDDDVTASFLSLFDVGLVDLHAASAPFVRTPGPSPTASSLARHQVEAGHERVCTLSHRMLDVSAPPLRDFVLMLDGTRTLDDLKVEWAAGPHRGIPFDNAMGVAIKGALML